MERDPMDAELSELRKFREEVANIAARIESSAKATDVSIEMKFYYLGVNLATLSQLLKRNQS